MPIRAILSKDGLHRLRFATPSVWHDDAERGPFSNRSSIVKGVVFYRPARVMVLSAVGVNRRNIWSGPEGGSCKVHNELTCDHVPTAPTTQSPAPSPRGDAFVREAANEFDTATQPGSAVTSGTARPISRQRAESPRVCGPRLCAPCQDRNAVRSPRPNLSGATIA